MRWKLLISVLGVFLVSVFLIGRPLLAQDNQLYEEISILQVTHFTLESATDVNIIVYAPNSNEVTLFYPNINKYESQAMKKIDNHYWEGIIPQEELMAGYVEYFVEVDSPEGSKRSDIQSIEVNPHLRINSENEVLALGDYFYDIQFYKGKLPSGYTIPSSISSSVRSPIRNGSYDAYPLVNSKLAEIRSTSPNPHNGVDLSVYGIPVYPTLPGRVVYTGGTFGMVIIGHGNYNPSTNTADYYSRYLHLSNIPSFSIGQEVSNTTLIGIASNTGVEGCHLDFSFYIKDSNGRNRFMPTQYFYSNRSVWNYARDLDFAQPPRILYDDQGTRVEINVYPKGGIDSQILTVTVVWRVEGSDSWRRHTMTKTSSYLYEYKFPLNPDPYDVEYYIEIVRDKTSGRQYRPMENGLQGPDGDEPPSIYYKARVHPGVIIQQEP